MSDEEPTIESIVEGEIEASPEQVQKEPEESSPSVDTKEETGDGVQKRINKLTAEKYEQKRKNEELQAELDEIKAKAEPEKEPELEDYDYDDEAYRKAEIAHGVKLELETQRKAQSDNEQKATRERATRDLEVSFATKEAEFSTKTEDYADKVSNLPGFSQDTLETIYSLDDGPKMAYYLANHLDIAAEISTASPLQAAVRLGQIAAGFTSPKGAVNTTKAPAPTETISGAGSVSKSVDEMSMEEVFNMG